MLVGTISKLGKSYSVDSRLIDVKTAENYVSRAELGIIYFDEIDKN